MTSYEAPIVLQPAVQRIRRRPDPPARSASAAAKKRKSPMETWAVRFIAFTTLVWLATPVTGFATGVAILTVLGYLAAAVGLFRRIEVGILGIGILCTVDPLTRTYLMSGGILRWHTFNYFLIAITLVSLPYLARLRGTPVRFLLVLVLVLGTGLLYSPDPREGMHHLAGLLSLFGLMSYFARARRIPDLWPWLGLLVGTVAGVGAPMFLLRPGDALYVDPNAWVFVPLTGLVGTVLGYRLAKGARLRRLLAIACMANAAWVFLSASRGGILSASIALLLMMGRIVQERRIGVVLVCLVGFVGILSQFDELREDSVGRVLKLLDSRQSMRSRTSGRADLVIGAWRIFEQHPIAGVGTGGFAASWFHLQDVRGLSTYRANQEVDAHAGWMKVLAENGVIGFSVLAAFVASFAFRGVSYRQRGLMGIGILTSCLLALAFISTEFQGKGLWFLAGAAIVMLQGSRNPATPARRFPTQAAAHARGDV